MLTDKPIHFAHYIRSVAATRLKFRNNVTQNLTYSNHADSFEIAPRAILPAESAMKTMLASKTATFL